jgi:hypothetical protein
VQGNCFLLHSFAQQAEKHPRAQCSDGQSGVMLFVHMFVLASSYNGIKTLALQQVFSTAAGTLGKGVETAHHIKSQILSCLSCLPLSQTSLQVQAFTESTKNALVVDANPPSWISWN